MGFDCVEGGKMLYIKQKEYVYNKSYSHVKFQNVLYSLLQGTALFLIVVGLLGGLWESFQIAFSDKVFFYEDSSVVKVNDLYEKISSSCSVIVTFKEAWGNIAKYCIIVTLGFSIFQSRKGKSIIAILYSLATIVISWRHKEEIFCGGRYIVESFLGFYNAYFGTKLTCTNVAEIDTIWVGEATLCAAAILVILCGMEIFFFHSAKVSLILFVLECSIIFIVGLVPHTFYSCITILGIVIVWALGKNQESLNVCKNKGRIVVERAYSEKVGIQNVIFVVIMALFVFSFITKNLLTPCFIWFENHREFSTAIKDIGNLQPENVISRVEQIVDSLTEEKPGEDGMGMSGGKLGRAESIKGNGEIDLVVTVDGKYRGYIYLKGYAASVYKGNAWSQVSSVVSTDYETLADSKMLRKKIMLYNLGASSTEIKVTVERTKANAKYSYIPYFSVIDSSETQYYLNGWIKGDGESVKEYVTFPLINPNELIRVFKDISSDWKVEDLESSSMKEMLSICLEYPEELETIKTDFMLFLERYNVSNFGALTELIKEYLASKATYSLSPGVTPKDRDFVEYFLTEQKKGYCVHFATSAAILYRMCGYPTRYVEGYLARVNSKGVAEVKNNTAHAWVEVYLDGFGWIPVDVTPGYSWGEIPNNDGLEENSSEVVDETIEGTKEKEDSGNLVGNIIPGENSSHTGSHNNWGGNHNSNQTGNDGQSGGNSSNQKQIDFWLLCKQIFMVILKNLAPILLVLLFMWLIIWIRSYILLSQRRKRISMGSNRHIVLSLYEFTCKLASKQDIFMDSEGSAEEMHQKLVSCKIEQIEQWKQIVQKAYFYPKPITKEERLLVVGIYQTIYDIAKEKRNGANKLRFVYCYPEI